MWAEDAETNEVRKSKRNFEHKLAQNIKSDSKSFYAYVRSKQNVRDKVGPLEENAGNIITHALLLAQELNMHFSSVFTREYTSWYGMVWCLFIQHQRTSYIAQITHDAEREMHEV